MYKLTVRGRENLGMVSSPFIIIANHPTVSGSFLFRLILGFLTPHLPLRFMAVRHFDWPWLNFLARIGLIDFIYSLFGVFTVIPGRGLARNLEEAKRIIRSRGNVVIYPEGKLANSEAIRPFKPGAAVLAIETDAPVVPVSFRLGKRKLFRRPITVTIGSPMKIPADMHRNQATAVFFDAILKLYEKK